MQLPIEITVDFNNCDVKGRVRLNTNGAFKDLENSKIKLEPGLKVLLDDNEGLAIEGIVEFSNEENILVAKIDWNKLNNIF